MQPDNRDSSEEISWKMLREGNLIIVKKLQLKIGRRCKRRGRKVWKFSYRFRLDVTFWPTWYVRVINFYCDGRIQWIEWHHCEERIIEIIVVIFNFQETESKN